MSVFLPWDLVYSNFVDHRASGGVDDSLNLVHVIQILSLLIAIT
jgi:hypothetical protein